MTFRRPLAVLAVAGVLAAAALAVVNPADADPMTGTGTSLTVTGTAGDPVTLGGSYAYTPASATFDAMVESGSGRVQASVVDADGLDWVLTFTAPFGQTLTTGATYSGSVNGPTPPPLGISISSQNRVCTEATSSFTVNDAQFGAYGWLRHFDATFDQTCGSAGSLSGRIVLDDPTAPPAPDATATVVSLTQTRTGGMNITVRVRCTRTGWFTLNGSVTQKSALGTFVVDNPCSETAPIDVTAPVRVTSKTPFRAGTVAVSGSWMLQALYDPRGIERVYGSTSQTVTLGR